MCLCVYVTVAGIPMVDNCMAGYNSSIFAYGQTGAGKTHTMMGVVNAPGEARSDLVSEADTMGPMNDTDCDTDTAGSAQSAARHPQVSQTGRVTSRV